LTLSTHLELSITKISLILGITTLLGSCNAVKNVTQDQLLLTKNTIEVDGQKVDDFGVFSQLTQRPNTKIPLIGIPAGLHLYNLADQQPDSTFTNWVEKKTKREQRLIRLLSKKQLDELGNYYIGFNQWLKKSGDAPEVINETKTKKSQERIKQWYAKKGWFNVSVGYDITKNKRKASRAEITYNVTLKEPYYVNNISQKIESPVIDSIIQATKNNTFIKKATQYAATDFENERERINLQLRNSGLYNFDRDYINFEADTVNTGNKVNITYIIPQRTIEVNDSTKTVPFKVYTVNDVKIITDYSYANQGRKFQDSVHYNGYTLFSYDKLKYNPKAITDAIAISPNKIYRDVDRNLTYNQLSDLNVFKYPNITYQEDPRDLSHKSLVSTIFLTPRKKATLDASFDAFSSSIQQLGIGFKGSLFLRNVFRGAEILQISGNGSLGASKDVADNDSFFNISEFGVTSKLSIPRVMLPVNVDRWIPKYMAPTTNISLGFNVQNNIGLDRQNLSGVFNYNWHPSKTRTNSFDLFNVQFVRNLNTSNYFNIYTNSYNQANKIAQDIENANPGSIDPSLYSISQDNEIQLEIPSGINTFLNNSTQGVYPLDQEQTNTLSSVIQRENRLKENNLILSTNFTWTRDTRETIFDKNFSRFRWKLETAGEILSGISNLIGLEKNNTENYETLGVIFSQYAKVEAEFIKHWQVSNDYVLAIRAFGGIAIPYGNSESIPFTRSYFAGGANDNRGWRPYDLGPGSSASLFEFNEANFKLAFNLEYRFPILGAFKGALFIDGGNIWNALDNVKDESLRFSGLEDLKELAIASGLGLRYDFGFFVARLDTGFKIHNPALAKSNRWFKESNFANAVFNIGINYPF
jgi:outer membrane protein assembly factor BamA